MTSAAHDSTSLNPNQERSGGLKKPGCQPPAPKSAGGLDATCELDASEIWVTQLVSIPVHGEGWNRGLGVFVVGEPLPLPDELLPELPQMRRRPAERRQTQAGKYA